MESVCRTSHLLQVEVLLHFYHSVQLVHSDAFFHRACRLEPSPGWFLVFLLSQADVYWDGNNSSKVLSFRFQVPLQWSDSGPVQTGQFSDWQTGSSVPALLQQEKLPQLGRRYSVRVPVFCCFSLFLTIVPVAVFPWPLEFAQNLNMGIKNWSWKQLNLETEYFVQVI